MAKPKPASRPPFDLAFLGRTGIVLVVLVALTLILFAPVLGPNRMLLGTDYLSTGYFARAFLRAEVLTHHELPLWQPLIMGGVPVVDAFYGDVFYPLTMLLRVLFSPAVVLLLLFLTHIVLAGLFLYLFLRDFGLRPPAALVAGIGYAFTGCIISLVYAGQDGRLMVDCLLPLVLFLLQRACDRRSFFYFLLLGLVSGCVILVAHLQMVYYLALTAFAFLVYKLVVAARARGPTAVIKPIGGSLLALAIAVGLAAVQLLPFLFYLAFSPRGGSLRGYEFATSWSMPPEETLNLLTPHFSGLLDNYWGRNYFKLHTEYLGILPLVLALVAIISRPRDRRVLFLTILGLVALLFAWGGHTPVYRLFYLLPYIAKTRAPSQIFYVVAFAVSCLAGLGVEQLTSEGDPGRRRRLERILWGSAAGLLVLWLLSLVLRTPLVDGLARLVATDNPTKAANLESNFGRFQGGLLWATALALLGALLGMLVLRRRLRPLVFAALASAVLVLDLFIIDRSFIRAGPPPGEYFARDEVVGFLTGDRSIFRVFPLQYRGDNYLVLYNIQNIDGEHGNQLQRYQEFIGAENTVMFQNPRNLVYPNFLNLLNTKYIITQQPLSFFREVARSARFLIYENDSCLARAFVVGQYEVIADRAAILERLRVPSFDPRRVAILETDPGLPRSDSVRAQVAISEYRPNRVELTATLDRPGLLVMLDNYYPLWQCTVDGQPTEVRRADYLFRAVALGPGTHRVAFRFVSPPLRRGTAVTLAVLGLAVLGLAASAWLERRRPRA